MNLKQYIQFIRQQKHDAHNSRLVAETVNAIIEALDSETNLSEYEKMKVLKKYRENMEV